jgi:hypothetical protein
MKYRHAWAGRMHVLHVPTCRVQHSGAGRHLKELLPPVQVALCVRLHHVLHRVELVPQVRAPCTAATHHFCPVTARLQIRLMHEEVLLGARLLAALMGVAILLACSYPVLSRLVLTSNSDLTSYNH